jgi:hypothetical protein
MPKTRSSPTRVAELKRWLKKNRTARCAEFVKETGGTPPQFYKMRKNLGIGHRNVALSESMKQAAIRRKAAAEAAKIAPTADLFEKNKANETFLADKSVPVFKPEEVPEGSTPDFMWYELDLMQRRLSDFSLRLNVVMKLSRARDTDHKKMMRDLINENSELRVSNNDLRQQVAEFTEMINGAPV